MKLKPKKIWDLYTAIRNMLGLSIGSFLVLFVIAVPMVYAGGLWAGAFSLTSASIAHALYYFRMKKRMGAENPFDLCYGLFGSRTYQQNRGFYGQVNEYMQSVTPKHKPQAVIYISYAIVAILMIIRPVETIDLLDAAVVGFIYFVFVSVGHVMFHRAKAAWNAKDPSRISKFFGIPEKEWRVDIKPVQRPPSITSIMWLFLGLGVLGLVVAPVMLITRVLGMHLVPFLEELTTAKIVVMGIGVALLGSFCLAAGLRLRKMMKDGAWLAVLHSLLAILVDVITFIVVPLAGQVPIPLYHVVWMFGIPLGVIYIIKRNWRKFKGW